MFLLNYPPSFHELHKRLGPVKAERELLDRLEKRRAEGLASPRQIRQLEQRGFKNVPMWTREQAKRLIDRIAANGWKTPKTINPQTYVPPADMNTLDPW